MPIAHDSNAIRLADERHQNAVLLFLRDAYPAVTSEPELVRALVADASAGERDAVECAVRELEAVGVVHRLEDFVLLTRTAVHTADLCDSL
jgi:hypothetical protein